MIKYCIFDSKKICDNCGECERCSLNPKKKCDNCGKCLEMEGYDTKAINITEVLENDTNMEAINSNENNSKCHSHCTDNNNDNDNCNDELVDLDSDTEEEYIDVFDKEDMLEYIDDVKDLSEILNDNQFSNNLTHEQYPGLVILDKQK